MVLSQYVRLSGACLAQCVEQATTCHTAENGPGLNPTRSLHVFPSCSLCFPVISSLYLSFSFLKKAKITASYTHIVENLNTGCERNM